MEHNDPQRAPGRPRRAFRLILLGVAAVGVLFLAFSLLRPHHTGVVTRVGRVGSASIATGAGIHRSEHKGYSADVKVRRADTGETVTVYYRVRNAGSIPEEGDEVAFAWSALIGGNTPYPEKWAVVLGILLLGGAALVFVVSLAVPRKTPPGGKSR